MNDKTYQAEGLEDVGVPRGATPDPNNPGQRINIGPQDVDMFEVVAPDDGNLIVQTNTSAYGAQAVDTFERSGLPHLSDSLPRGRNVARFDCFFKHPEICQDGGHPGLCSKRRGRNFRPLGNLRPRNKIQRFVGGLAQRQRELGGR